MFSRETTEIRRAAALVVILMSAACGASPTTPAASNLPFEQGTYLVAFDGSDIVAIPNGPLSPGCPGIAAAGIGHVLTQVTLEPDGRDWRARPSTSEGGAFELRFTEGRVQPGGPGGGLGIAGTATGVAISSFDFGTLGFFQSLRDARVTFGSSPGASVSFGGGVSPTGYVAGGRVSGEVVFSNSQGASITCSPGSVVWFMSRLERPSGI